jgi:hypothetical protein
MSRDKVFISCGQHTERERALGKGIVQLVEELTPFEGYFAQNVSSLEGLTGSILPTLREAVGFIYVMHHRGQIVGPDGLLDPPNQRGSTWVEQELAIACFMQQTLGWKLHVAAFEQEGIRREGLRSLLHLNPVSFRDDEDVLRALRSMLPGWAAPLRTVRSVRLLRPAIRRDAKNSRRGQLILRNEGTEAIREFKVELRIPRGLCGPNHALSDQDESLNTSTQIGVSRSQDRFSRFPGVLPIYPGRDLEIYPFDLEWKEIQWLRRAEIGPHQIEVTVLAPDMEPQTLAVSLNELGLLDCTVPEPYEVLDPNPRRDRYIGPVLEHHEKTKGSGGALEWRYEHELPPTNEHGRPFYFFENRQRVITHMGRNGGDKSRPPEYLVYRSALKEMQP